MLVVQLELLDNGTATLAFLACPGPLFVFFVAAVAHKSPNASAFFSLGTLTVDDVPESVVPLDRLGWVGVALVKFPNGEGDVKEEVPAPVLDWNELNPLFVFTELLKPEFTVGAAEKEPKLDVPDWPVGALWKTENKLSALLAGAGAGAAGAAWKSSNSSTDPEAAVFVFGAGAAGGSSNENKSTGGVFWGLAFGGGGGVAEVGLVGLST